jgi:hypothetical protein
MRRLFPILTVLVVALATPVAAQTTVGVNAAVENRVQTRSAGERDWRPSVVDGTVRQADAIVTGADSRLLIRLLDQSVLTVGANAAFNVDRFVIDTETDPAGVLVSMARGAFRFVSGSRGAERERVAFRTPTATIGIRGTIIEAAVGSEALELLDGEAGTPVPGDEPDQAAVIVLVEGEIEIEVDGVRRIVSEPGQAVAVRGRRVSEPFRLSPEAGQRLAGRLPPREPAGPGGGPQGQGPEGQGPGGQSPQGQPPQGQGAQGSGSQGSGPQGSGPQGQGAAPQGQAPQGQAPQGQAAKGETPRGQAPEGRGRRGQENRGTTSRPGSAGPGQQPGQGGGLGAGPGGGQRPG